MKSEWKSNGRVWLGSLDLEVCPVTGSGAQSLLGSNGTKPVKTGSETFLCSWERRSLGHEIGSCVGNGAFVNRRRGCT